jgi:hypothetical protein
MEIDGAGDTVWASSRKALICRVAADACQDAVGLGLRALVLTGSLARDEATFVDSQEGTELLGDAEFLVLLSEGAHMPDAAFADLSRRVERELARRGLRGHVSLNGCRPRYLRRLKPHIFAHELTACGQVVWGDGRILDLIPPFEVSAIPHEDAWRLLCNRIVELLEPLAALKWPCPRPSRALRYRTAKLYLDMATSFLLFAGAYAPTYRDRAQALRGLAERAGASVDCPLPLDAFASRVEACTRYKLHATGGEDLGSWPSWREALDQAHVLWRWELARMTGGSEEASDRALWERWRCRQPARARVRGWLHVLRSRGWHRSWRQWLRWSGMAMRSAPRQWVYAAGTELVFALSSRLDAEWPPDIDCAELMSWLPMRALPEVGRAPWQQAAHEVSVNYREFLVGTRS